MLPPTSAFEAASKEHFCNFGLARARPQCIERAQQENNPSRPLKLRRGRRSESAIEIKPAEALKDDQGAVEAVVPLELEGEEKSAMPKPRAMNVDADALIAVGKEQPLSFQ